MAFIFVETDEEAVPEHVNQYGDALSGTPGKGQTILLTSLNNAASYALTVRNQDATNGRTLDVLRQDGAASWYRVDKLGNHMLGILLAQQAEPATPASGETALYADTGGVIKVKLPSGATTSVGGGGTDSLMLMGG